MLLSWGPIVLLYRELPRSTSAKLSSGSLVMVGCSFFLPFFFWTKNTLIKLMKIN